MIDYVFTYEVVGDMDIKAKSKQDAEEIVNNFSEGELFMISNSFILKAKCIGTRNKDGSINYFE